MIKLGEIITFKVDDEILRYEVRKNFEDQYYLNLQNKTGRIENDHIFTKMKLDTNEFCNTGIKGGIFPYHESLKQLDKTVCKLQKECERQYQTKSKFLSDIGDKYKGIYSLVYATEKQLINNKIELNDLSRKIISQSGLFEGRSFAVSSSKEEIRI